MTHNCENLLIAKPMAASGQALDRADPAWDPKPVARGYDRSAGTSCVTYYSASTRLETPSVSLLFVHPPKESHL